MDRLSLVVQDYSRSVIASSVLVSNKIWGWESEATGFPLSWVDSSEFGGISDVSVTSSLTSNSDDSSVDGARNTVIQFCIELWENHVAFLIGAVILNIFSGRLIDYLSHAESLDGFVLWEDSTAVQASNDVGVALVFLGSSVVSSF